LAGGASSSGWIIEISCADRGETVVGLISGCH
jgi:hypothetical protein